jgi:uncharacterized protein YegL
MIVATTHLALIVDQSGSMDGKQSDVIGGVNEFIRTHKAIKGEASLTTCRFHISNTTVHNPDIQNASEWTPGDYSPGGGTALLDAIGQTMELLGERVHRGANAEDQVIVCIITDGQENASTQYSLASIKNMIEHCRKHGWFFLFLGAGIDAFAQAGAMGIGAHTTTAYQNTTVGTQSAYASSTSASTQIRMTGSLPTSSMSNILKEEEAKKATTP